MKTHSSATRGAIAAALALGASAVMAQALPVTWAQWAVGTQPTRVNGQLMLAGGNVAVRYRGPAYLLVNSGAAGEEDVWTSGSTDPYAVTGRPVGTGSLAFDGSTSGKTYTLTFNTPVQDPVLALSSVGAPGVPVRMKFKQTPTLLSSGAGHWGGCGTCLSVQGKLVIGEEGNGVIQFAGRHSVISWTVPNHEYFHAVTVGAPVVSQAVTPGIALPPDSRFSLDDGQSTNNPPPPPVRK